jgi:hypothetical protein
MCDKLIFDLSQEIEGSPNVFIRKDWINILDNQNQNYNNNQSVVDTSQLSNSNRYMSYRESYFLIPMVATLTQTGFLNDPKIALPTAPAPLSADRAGFCPAQNTRSADYVIGLKNWFGQIIHSFTLDYNGTTICQQTPYINMWNSFKLMTSLSLDDINTQGATIGFYPDDAKSWQFIPAQTGVTGGLDALESERFGGACGQGVCNNSNFQVFPDTSDRFNNFKSGKGNEGFFNRQNVINFDVNGITGLAYDGVTDLIPSYGDLLTGSSSGSGVTPDVWSGSGSSQASQQVWKSYISTKVNTIRSAETTISQQGVIQFTINATVYLKHIHSFFNMCPLLKGVFMKMTMNLNNSTTSFNAVAIGSGTAPAPILPYNAQLFCTGVTNAVGGINPLLIASGSGSSTNGFNGGSCLFRPKITAGSTLADDEVVAYSYKMNISVGANVLDSSLGLNNAYQGTGAKSVYLYIPAYTFNPTFEQAYLSSPVKQIKYTDVYQYQVQGISSTSTFNNLLTNGIANVKSVLICPFYSTQGGTSKTDTRTNQVVSGNTGLAQGIPVFQSPFDTAGAGTTSPLCWLTNFNIQVSGQNAIYNTQRYNFEQFNNQLYGQNAVNGGCTDGLTSGLIDRTRFDMEYCYYYVNVERMLPVEASVPKSIQILGQNLSGKTLDLWCFVEYGSEISIDCLTGARV